MTASQLLAISGLILALRGSYLNKTGSSEEDKSNARWNSGLALLLCGLALIFN